MAKSVANSFEKFVNNGTVIIDPNDESTMEIVIKMHTLNLLII